MKPYVCVVGAVNLDICGRPEKKLIFRDSNPGAVTLTPGGVGRNIAHDLRLLGVEVKFLTAFGGDSHAQLLRNDCVELGMDLSCALDVPGGRTSTYLYITDERGEMQLGLCDTDISAAITPAYLQRHLDVLNSAAAVVLDGNLTAETITWLGTHCSAPLFADPVSVTKAERMRAALGALHTFKPNLTEGQNLTGESTPEGIVAALLALLAGFAAGALWALLPTLFAGRNLTSLSVATIMMNSIAALLTEYIVKSYFQRPGASNTETVVVNEGSILPRIFPSTQFNYGILVALFCVVVVTWMLYKTPFGFSLRAMGSNPRAMQQAGLPIYGRTIAAMCISGGLFALGGSIQCLAVYKRFVMGFSPGYGWDGITVATLAMNSPVGVLLSAFLFGMLRSASISMSLTSQVTTEMISVLQGFIVMLVASPDVWNVLGHLWQRLKGCVGRGRKQEGAAE